MMLVTMIRSQEAKEAAAFPCLPLRMRSWVRCLVAALGATTIMSALAASDGAGSTDDVVARLSDLLNAKDAVAAFARVAADDELRALSLFAEQAVARGIDYASLGQSWDHPDSRIAYREVRRGSKVHDIAM